MNLLLSLLPFHEHRWYHISILLILIYHHVLVIGSVCLLLEDLLPLLILELYLAELDALVEVLHLESILVLEDLSDCSDQVPHDQG